MLGGAPAGANIPVKDVQEARRFYEGVVGATEMWSNEGNVVYRTGGTHWAIYESAGAGRAEHTLLTFLVNDVGEMVRELRRRVCRPRSTT